MVKHVILWKLDEKLTDSEKDQVKAGIKEGLEGLAGQIPGLVDITVRTEGLPSSNVDVMLDSTFVDAESLKGYARSGCGRQSETVHGIKVLYGLRNLIIQCCI